MDAAGLRPLRVGETLDAGIQIYRRRFQTLTRAVAVVVVPIAVVNAIITLSASPSRDGATGRDVAAFAGASLVTTILGLVATELATAACFEIVSGDYLDREPTWQESLRSAWTRLRSVIWVAFLHFALAGLALLGCIVPGVYLWYSWTLVVPIVLFEDKRGFAALSRSRELVKGRWWPVVGTLLLMTLLSSIVTGALQGVLLGIVSHSNDVVAAVARSIVTSATSILVTPFSAAVVTVLYFDQRVRKEGFDLELLAQGIGVEATPEMRAMFEAGPPPSVAGEEPPFWPPPPGWQPGRPPE